MRRGQSEPCEEENVFNRSEDVALLVGRLFLAALFLPSGFDKLLHFSKFASSFASKGLPYPEIWAVLGVAIEVLGPIALMVGAWSRWTAVALIAFTMAMTWINHRPSLFAMAFRQPQDPQLFKNVAVVGGLLFYFGSGPGAWSWRRGGA
jgi:putative oxidoreductase